MGKDVKVGLGLCLVIGLLLFLIYGIGRHPVKQEQARPFAAQGWQQELPSPELNDDSLVEGIVPGAPVDTDVVPVDSAPPEKEVTQEERQVEPEEELEAPPVAPYPTRFYVVVKGDSPWKIAQKFYGQGQHWKHILEANQSTLADARRLQPGDRIIIPVLSVSPVPTSASRQGHATGNTKKFYVVGSGDTLSCIAKRTYGSERYWKRIWQANKKLIRDPNRLAKGWRLVIPKLTEPAA